MRFTNIQALRFFAALAVLVCHLGRSASHYMGWPGESLLGNHIDPFLGLGVPIFFVISGFVLTHNLQTTSIRRYLQLRMLRLYPPYWVAVIVVTLLAFPWVKFHDLRFLGGLSLLPLNRGDGKSWAIYVLGGVEWTLVYEVFFSLALAGLALFGRRGVLVGTSLWLGLCLVRCVLAPVNDSLQWPSFLQLPLSPNNFPFLCGVFLYHLRERGLPWRQWAPFLSALLLYGSMLFVPHYDVVMALAALGSVLLVWYVITAPPLAANHLLVRHGDYSYGVYLLHLPIYLFVFTAVAKWHWFAPSTHLILCTGLLALCLGGLYGQLEQAAYHRLRRWLLGREKPATTRPALPVSRAA